MNLTPQTTVHRKIAHAAGIVLSLDGKGGSGTFVRLEDDQIAILTAKHVVIECIRSTGEFLIWAPLFDAKFRKPTMIRMDSSQQGDAAFVIFEDPPVGIEPIAFDEWTRNGSLAAGTEVLACGFPAALRKVEGRKITPKIGAFHSRVASLGGNTFVCPINETAESLGTFEGLSGGGVFSMDGEFAGIVTGERRRISASYGELYSIRPRGFAEIFTPYSFPPDAPKGGYLGQKQSLSLHIKKSDGSILATVGCLAELMWSKTEPAHKHGKIGRLLTIEFIYPDHERHYPVNIESMFYWEDDTEEGRTAAIQSEFKFVLMRMGWLVADSEDGPSTIQINAMV